MPWRVSSTVTMATVFPRTNGHVLASAGVVAELLAGADGEARSELTGRADALACPWRVHARSGASWARLGARCTGRCRRLLVLGVYQRDQESEGDFQDTMEVRGEGRSDEWHGGDHE